jgi:hypothetical protein
VNVSNASAKSQPLKSNLIKSALLEPDLQVQLNTHMANCSLGSILEQWPPLVEKVHAPEQVALFCPMGVV